MTKMGDWGKAWPKPIISAKNPRPHDAPARSGPCRSRHVMLALCVTSSRDHLAMRDAIRATWGSPEIRGDDVSIIFFLASAAADEDPALARALTAEAARHGDIVTGAFVDDYYNLTLKTLDILQYSSGACGTADYVFKADDDVYVNVPLLLMAVTQHARRRYGRPFVLGCVVRHGVPLRQVGGPLHKVNTFTKLI